MIADKYRFYQQEVRRLKLQAKGTNKNVYSAAVPASASASGATPSEDGVMYLTKENAGEQTIEARVLDALHLSNVCCRRHMLTHVDIE